MSDLEEKKESLLFSVRRSVRYHNRRRAFFDNLHVIVSFVSVLFGSAAIYTVFSSLGKNYTVGAAVIVTLFSSVDLVIGTSQKARHHSDLARRFIELEKEIINTSPLTEDNLRKFISQRLDIELDEPPVKRILDVICHNEQMRSMGYSKDELCKIRWYQRLVAQFSNFSDHIISYDKKEP